MLKPNECCSFMLILFTPDVVILFFLGVKYEDRTLDKEEETRKNLRAEEQVARSSRTLYSLRQQVREIQEEFLRIGKGRLRATKKVLMNFMIKYLYYPTISPVFVWLFVILAQNLEPISTKFCISVMHGHTPMKTLRLLCKTGKTKTSSQRSIIILNFLGL